jgi:hypothetical protein
MALGTATRKLFVSAFWTTWSSRATWNQRSVKPPHRATADDASLKAKITTTTMGR